MKIFDVSLPLSAAVAEWPGDAKFSLSATMSQCSGDTVNVGRITTSLHMATHVDAPFHVDQKEATIDALPLIDFFGPCQLVDVRGHDVIRREHLAAVDLTVAPRLLLRTGGWTEHSVFPRTIPVIDGELPSYLAGEGVRLLGVDVPSVDPLDSEELRNHHALRKVGIHILESLDLRLPPPGVYELIALPLKIVGGDGSPVRAVLVER